MKRTSANRCHHLLKTFWGWRDKQLPDRTVIWTLPDGHTYVTTPGSAPLFPSLWAPTGEAPTHDPAVRCGNREAMMPLRTRTRSQNRAHRINTERAHNRLSRQATHTVAVGAEHTKARHPIPTTHRRSRSR